MSVRTKDLQFSYIDSKATVFEMKGKSSKNKKDKRKDSHQSEVDSSSAIFDKVNSLNCHLIIF